MALRTLLSEAVAAADPALRDRLLTEPAAYVDFVALSARARIETEVLLTLAVAGARSAGCTWEDIGAALGVTGSAARELYSPPDPAPDAPSSSADKTGPALPAVRTTSTTPGTPPSAERTQTLTRVTMFREMDTLDHAGRYGWHLVGSGTASLVVRSSAEQWEHRRVFASRAKGRALEQEGWTQCGRPWFPWAYFTRPTGLPALPDPLDGSDLRPPSVASA
jgi:hypothetical protein